MIVYDLSCQCGHRFEGWFKSRDAFDRQVEAGMIDCPACGGSQVQKRLSAPKIGGKAESTTTRPAPSSDAMASGMPAELASAIANLRQKVAETCDYVGSNFAEEARSIHYGDVEERPIYGEASAEQARDLHEEGIMAIPLPFPAGPKLKN